MDDALLSKELKELQTAEKNCHPHLLDIWPGRSPVQADRVHPSAGSKVWLPPTFAYPWGMVYILDPEDAEEAAAAPSTKTPVSEIPLYCPVMAMPSEAELPDTGMYTSGLCLANLQDPQLHPMLPSQLIAKGKQSKMFRGVLCQRIHDGFLC